MLKIEPTRSFKVGNVRRSSSACQPKAYSIMDDPFSGEAQRISPASSFTKGNERDGQISSSRGECHRGGDLCLMNPKRAQIRFASTNWKMLYGEQK